MSERLKRFPVDGKQRVLRFVSTLAVKEGVQCDAYAFKADHTKDLAIVTVKPEHKTPRQQVMNGDVTTEGYLSGSGILTVTSADGTVEAYKFPGPENRAVSVAIGQIMQWHADTNEPLVFYEICEPPYANDRFQDLPDES